MTDADRQALSHIHLGPRHSLTAGAVGPPCLMTALGVTSPFQVDLLTASRARESSWPGMPNIIDLLRHLVHAALQLLGPKRHRRERESHIPPHLQYKKLPSLTPMTHHSTGPPKQQKDLKHLEGASQQWCTAALTAVHRLSG